MKRKKDKRYRIRINSYTKGGIKSSLMCFASLIILALAVFISFKMKGNAGIWIGLLPLAAFAVSIAGFRVGVKSFEEDADGKFLKYSYIGTISNAAIWLIIVGVYLAFV